LLAADVFAGAAAELDVARTEVATVVAGLDATVVAGLDTTGAAEVETASETAEPPEQVPKRGLHPVPQ
jgi:hypothetical protein